MKLRDVVNQSEANAAARIYGEPYETTDGATILTVTRYRGVLGPAPVGVFVVHGGTVSWEPPSTQSGSALRRIHRTGGRRDRHPRHAPPSSVAGPRAKGLTRRAGRESRPGRKT